METMIYNTPSILLHSFLAQAGGQAAPEEAAGMMDIIFSGGIVGCLLYTSPSPRDLSTSRMPSSA